MLASCETVRLLRRPRRRMLGRPTILSLVVHLTEFHRRLWRSAATVAVTESNYCDENNICNDDYSRSERCLQLLFSDSSMMSLCHLLLPDDPLCQKLFGTFGSRGASAETDISRCASFNIFSCSQLSSETCAEISPMVETAENAAVRFILIDCGICFVYDLSLTIDPGVQDHEKVKKLRVECCSPTYLFCNRRSSS